MIGFWDSKLPDAAGQVSLVVRRQEGARMAEAEGLPEVKLLRADGRAMSGDTHFGGRPQFIQVDNTPDCCGRPMALLVQLDGLDFPEADLPDSALAYLWVCRRCFQVSSDLQCM